jgi:amino acid transporter
MPTDQDAPGGQPKDEPNGPPSPADRPTPSSSSVIRLDSGVAGGVSGDSHVGVDGAPLIQEDHPTLRQRVKTLLIGKPRDLADKSIFKHISLVAFLAWVGLGADGLSSSCYGPPEAFANLGEHSYLAVFLAMAIVGTVFIIATCYSHIIEEFPSGGGGYLVASKLLGRRVGVISGCALLVDYVMTITVSIAAAGDALFSLMDKSLQPWKLPVEFAAIVVLIVLNLRGVKESVQILMPIFLLFLLTHIVLIVGSIALHVSRVGERAQEIATQVETGIRDPNLGLFAMLALLLHAYSLGAGTYTGLEAVSNSMPVIREPRVHNAKKTMLYMAFSLAFTAGGLIVAYLLLGIQASEDKEKTMNFLLTRSFIDETGMTSSWLGYAFLFVTLASEGALLIVGAQAGFIDGPRVLGYMAHDSWMPRWFANLSERLATHNGIMLMGLLALGALMYTHGDVGMLVIMYSINVFVTFSLSMIGMCRHWYGLRKENPLWRRRLALFVCGTVLCASILIVTTLEKFTEGGWLTIVVTSLCVAVSFGIHRYYQKVGERLKHLDETLGQLTGSGEPAQGEPDPNLPAAAVLVGGYSGIGIHTMLNAIRFAPDHFRSFLFISVGVIDSGNFKGSSEIEALRAHTEESLQQYCDLSRRLGMPAASFMAIDTDAVDGLESVCLEVAQKYPKATFFAGQLVFQKDTWLHRLLHNQTAYMLQRRLQWIGLPMVILPTRVR